MPAAGKLARLAQIAVGEQHRRFGLVGLDAGGEHRHHVRPVGIIGDAAEAFGLALGAVVAARTVEPGELQVGLRIDQRLDFQRERPVRRLRDGEAVRARDIAVAGDRRAIDLERDQGEPLAVEHQRGGRAGGGIGLEFQRRAHRRLRRMQLHVEIDGLDQPVGRPVFGKADGARFFGAHHVRVRLPINGWDAIYAPAGGQSHVARSRTASRHSMCSIETLTGEASHDTCIQFRLSVLPAEQRLCRDGSSFAPPRRVVAAAPRDRRQRDRRRRRRRPEPRKPAGRSCSRAAACSRSTRAVGDFEQADVLIEGKKISAVQPNISAPNAQVIDASKPHRHAGLRRYAPPHVAGLPAQRAAGRLARRLPQRRAAHVRRQDDARTTSMPPTTSVRSARSMRA